MARMAGLDRLRLDRPGGSLTDLRPGRRHRPGACPERLRGATTPFDVLGHDPSDELRERRHLEQPQADPDRGELLRSVAAIEATAGDGAHLVVQLGPADPSPTMTEADELDR